MESINASYFKARCLKILDRVRETGERIVILKRGRPVAELWPPSESESKYPQSELKGTATIVGDIIGPVVPEHYWDSLKGTGGIEEPGGDANAPRKQSRRTGGE
ncbi:MAG: type II toxin-antitoxin system Phd/YefM family antitoxin [Gemmatimonadota bacterium]|nr:type II toxin-antitoxin system Phd/YefM family antitoxin [Gemmatimonadota bacterium]MDE2986164.1 type II toxin-antitoxin system Phd/YefM family antitoxin [Gemmatimonadota bacterium]